MSALRPGFVWALVFVAAAAGGVYLADRLVLEPGRAIQRQLAERDAQIRELTARNQALEAAMRPPRHTERLARPVAPHPAPHYAAPPRTAARPDGPRRTD